MKKISDSDIKTVFDATFDSIILTDELGKIIFANVATAHLLKCQRNDLKETSILDLIMELKEEEIEDLFSNVSLKSLILSGIVKNRKLTLSFKESGGTPVLFSASYFINSEGEKTLVCIAKDITSLTQAAENLEHERSHMAYVSKMKSLGEMSTGIAHEINNPLFIVTGLSHHLQEELTKDKVDRETCLSYISSIQNAVSRIDHIIRNMRSLAHHESSEKKEKISFRSIFEDTFVFCKSRIEEEGIELKKLQLHDQDEVFCNPSEVSQVLLNLLSNAIDAISKTESPWIQIISETKGKQLVVSVIDSGLGIPEELHKKISEPFFTTKPVGKGTGLGISIAKNLIHRQKGDLWLEPQRPNTTFCFSLLLYDPKI